MKNERELIQQLKGRAELCRDRGEVKTPELLERAIKALEQREGYKLVPVDKLMDCLHQISDRSYVDDNVSEIKAMLEAVER